MPATKVLVTGAGGFIGHHLTKFLINKGYWVRGVDVTRPKYEESPAQEFKIMDLRLRENCLIAAKAVDEIYHTAANMGGIGFITSNKADIMRDNILIDTHMIEAAKINQCKKYLYTSSACVYPQGKQDDPDVTPLKEEDAYPADSEDGYGWEKLFGEHLCRHYYEDYKLKTYTVRFHNIFGPLGTYDGGREKSPAAICRKIALAKNTDTIEVWGDGNQTRSYCYVDDCVRGMHMLMQSDFHKPINLGQDRMVTINELVDMVAKAANKKIQRRYDTSKPQGVRGRNADITLISKILGWTPEVSLEEGLKQTYFWILDQLTKEGRISTKRL